MASGAFLTAIWYIFYLPNTAIDVYIFLSVLYWENNHLKLAEENIQKAKKLSDKYNIVYNLDKIYHNMGLVYKSKMDFSNALYYFERSLDLKIQNMKNNKSITYRLLIELHLQIGDLQKAKDLIKTAISYSENEIEKCKLDILSAKVNFMEQEFELYEHIMGESIYFLCKMNETKDLVKLVEEFGSYLQERKQYKKAAHYFKLGLINERRKP